MTSELELIAKLVSAALPTGRPAAVRRLLSHAPEQKPRFKPLLTSCDNRSAGGASCELLHYRLAL